MEAETLKTEMVTLALAFSGVVIAAYGVQNDSTLIYFSGLLPMAAGCLYMRYAVRKTEREIEREEREARNRERAWQTFLNEKMPPER